VLTEGESSLGSMFVVGLPQKPAPDPCYASGGGSLPNKLLGSCYFPTRVGYWVQMALRMVEASLLTIHTPRLQTANRVDVGMINGIASLLLGTSHASLQCVMTPL
jgi:hypothetical protein